MGSLLTLLCLMHLFITGLLLVVPPFMAKDVEEVEGTDETEETQRPVS